MGVTRQATLHIFDKCKECDFRNGKKCTYLSHRTSKADPNEKCVWYRKGKSLNCPKGALQPIPYYIQGKDWNCPIIRYKCPKCGTTFDHYGSSERFCHGCGRELDWEGLIEKINPTTWKAIVSLCDNETITAKTRFLKCLIEKYKEDNK